MYIPKHFHEQDLDTLTDLIRRNNFGILITCQDNVPQVSHIPFIFEPGAGERGALWGHVAKANPHWKNIRPGSEALALFQGPHSYVSPTWYQDQSNVPTWNYTAIHVSGRIELIHDKKGLLDIVTRLTDFHESGRSPAWQVSNVGRRLDKLLGAIVGLKIDIGSMEGKFKLSQNRTHADQRGVITALTASDDPTLQGVAQLMKASLDRGDA